MTVQNASCSEGANVFQYTYNGTHNDEWLFEVSASTYYKSEAIRYALANYDTYLNTYPNLSYTVDESANFVSQCFSSGGKKYNDVWYVYKLNNTYLTPQNDTQLNYSWDIYNPSPWTSEVYFYIYWSIYAAHDTFTPADIINNNSATSTVYGKGDVVQILKWDSTWLDYVGHKTMLVTNVDDSDNKNTFKMTYHSQNTPGRRLLYICSNYNTSDYRVRFYKIV